MDADKIKMLFEELLEKYETAAESAIMEYSGQIDEELEELQQEIKEYKLKISEMTK